MADNYENGGNETKPPKGKAAKTQQEAIYDIAALTDGTTAWEHFDFTPELVATALKLAGKEKCTLTEAKQIVKAFAEREVK